MLNKIYVRVKDFFVINWKFLIFLLFVYLLFFVELPYVIYAPGGSIDLSDRIVVEGGYESEGRLEMAYVSMVRGSIPFIALSYVIPNWDLTPKEEITYENESIAEMMERDKIYLQESIDNATIAAFSLTNHEIKIKKTINHVAYIDSKADTNLKIGDDLQKVNGVEIASLDEFKDIIQAGKIDDVLTLTVIRNGKEKDCTIKIYDTDDGLKAGISIITTYEYETIPKLSISSKSSESGPSGGMMLALGIYDALTEDDLTRGRIIIGTGTITRDGVVGQIGGVKYKLIGAVKNKADIFICPIENLEEALEVKEKNKYNIKIIGVGSLSDAIRELQR